MLARKKCIKHAEEEKLKVFESSGLNSWNAAMLFKNYRQPFDKNGRISSAHNHHKNNGMHTTQTLLEILKEETETST